mmetsp:Transcript_22320/g.58194  ORF Transcript_22320/g.58194 Transcript_22320/m.58194 type:complete len:218 (+) Transcript_22320:203-856(+)
MPAWATFCTWCNVCSADGSHANAALLSGQGCESSIDGSLYDLRFGSVCTFFYSIFQISNRLNGAKRFGVRFGPAICCRNKIVTWSCLECAKSKTEFQSAKSAALLAQFCCLKPELARCLGKPWTPPWTPPDPFPKHPFTAQPLPSTSIASLLCCNFSSSSSSLSPAAAVPLCSCPASLHCCCCCCWPCFLPAYAHTAAKPRHSSCPFPFLPFQAALC